MATNILSKTRTSWLSPKEFREKYNITQPSMYRLIHIKGFPVKKFGKRTYRIDELEAQNFIEEVFNI